MMDNNVQDRIDDYLDQVFGPYEASPTAAELRIEIRHDLLERFSDLTEHGVGGEIAYAQVVSSVGDIEATLREIAEADRVREEGTTPAPEPDGPSATIDSDEAQAPGATWNPADAESETDSDNVHDGHTRTWTWGHSSDDAWVNDVAQSVAQGLDAIRAQVVSALEQVDAALGTTGLWDEEFRRRFETRTTRVWNGPHISYSASDLRGADFHDQQLPGTRFVASSLRNSNFSGATLTDSSFKTSDLRNSDFSRADLTGANLSMCSLRGTSFTGTNLTGANLSYSDMRGIDFTGATLVGTRAGYADLRNAVFNDCRMEGIEFTGSDLRGANFDGLSLTEISFRMANLSEASFKGATLRNVNFKHISRKAVMTAVFEDTVMDQLSYISLCSSGYTPQGIRVES